MLYVVLKIRLPATEVVVDVNGRHLPSAEAFLECRDAPGGGKRMPEKFRSLGKINVVDHVDQQQRGARHPATIAALGDAHR